jgi:hypothetical protein
VEHPLHSRGNFLPSVNRTSNECFSHNMLLHECNHEQRVFLIRCVAKRARVLLVSSTDEIATGLRRWTEEIHGGIFYRRSITSNEFFDMLRGKASTGTTSKQTKSPCATTEHFGHHVTRLYKCEVVLVFYVPMPRPEFTIAKLQCRVNFELTFFQAVLDVSVGDTN